MDNPRYLQHGSLTGLFNRISVGGRQWINLPGADAGRGDRAAENDFSAWADFDTLLLAAVLDRLVNS